MSQIIAKRQFPPSNQESDLARDSRQRLARYAKPKQSLTVHVTDTEHSEPIELPAGAVGLLLDILEAMAAGRGVTLIPEDAELTTVEAADILNVSRPYLIRLLENGDMPFRKVGAHRRIRLEDVMAYKEKVDQERESVLDELVEDAQDQNMGYEK